MSDARTYRATHRATGECRIIVATSEAQAGRHIASDWDISVASGVQVGAALANGAVFEFATPALARASAFNAAQVERSQRATSVAETTAGVGEESHG